MIAAMLNGRRSLVMTFVFVLSFQAQAVVNDIPLKGNEKLLISVTEATINLQANPALKSLRVSLVDGAQEDFQVTSSDGVIDIRSREAANKENFGKWSAKKRIIEIQGPALPLEVHAFEGQINLNKWSKEALLHLQKGHVLVRESSGTLKIHSQGGDVQVLNHQGRVEVDTYKANVAIRGLSGDADVENFGGETVIEKAKGFLSVNQGQGSAKIISSGGALQFELVKGVLNSVNFAGRVEGQTQEGPVNIQLSNDGEVNVKSQSGKVTVQSSGSSGASLSLTTIEGEIYGPSYLKVSRDGSQKTLRGRLKGESQKGSIVIRSQDGAIILK